MRTSQNLVREQPITFILHGSTCLVAIFPFNKHLAIQKFWIQWQEVLARAWLCRTSPAYYAASASTLWVIKSCATQFALYWLIHILEDLFSREHHEIFVIVPSWLGNNSRGGRNNSNIFSGTTHGSWLSLRGGSFKGVFASTPVSVESGPLSVWSSLHALFFLRKDETMEVWWWLLLLLWFLQSKLLL